jgi:poly(3-hydroxyalkanoate) synthetase
MPSPPDEHREDAMSRAMSGEDGEGRAASPFNPWLWPLLAAATASNAATTYLDGLARSCLVEPSSEAAPELHWATPNRVALDLTTVQLRDFSLRRVGVPVLVCAPFALHGATIADFAAGHSLIERLRDGGCNRVFLTDWRSANADMGRLTIDNYLADLNVMVDEIGAPIDLIGLCQGGWMALMFAARFPDKVRRLVIAGAPVDVRAAASMLSDVTHRLPLSTFAELVRLGGGRVKGSHVLDLWGPALAAEESTEILQPAEHLDADEARELAARFREWYGRTLDLPGAYYLQVVSWLFKENRLAEGRFEALGRRIDLGAVDHPIFLLAARDDALVAPDQLLAVARLVGTPADAIEIMVEPGTHLSLFVGKRTLDRAWGAIAAWLGRDLSTVERVRSAAGACPGEVDAGSPTRTCA